MLISDICWHVQVSVFSSSSHRKRSANPLVMWCVVAVACLRALGGSRFRAGASVRLGPSLRLAFDRHSRHAVEHGRPVCRLHGASRGECRGSTSSAGLPSKRLDLPDYGPRESLAVKQHAETSEPHRVAWSSDRGLVLDGASQAWRHSAPTGIRLKREAEPPEPHGRPARCIAEARRRTSPALLPQMAPRKGTSAPKSGGGGLKGQAM